MGIATLNPSYKPASFTVLSAQKLSEQHAIRLSVETVRQQMTLKTAVAIFDGNSCNP